MSRLTDADLAGIEALASAATPAPWVQWTEHAAVYAGRVRENTPGHIMGGFQVCDISDLEHADDEDERAQANAAFVAAIRNATPNLIATAHRLLEIESAARACVAADDAIRALADQLIDDETLAELDRASASFEQAREALRLLLDVTP